MVSKNPLLQRAYALEGDKDKIRSVYRDWAKSYDEDTLSGMGYVAPALAAEALAEQIGEGARVLDTGCGTGLVGLEISRRSSAAIDGCDLSPAMLEEARAKNVYADLRPVDLTRPLDVADDSYDGVISVGVFTFGHVGPEVFDELSRVARPGAPLVITVHEDVWEDEGYPDHIQGMEERGLIRVRDISECAYHEKEGQRCRLCVLEVA